ncbi:hypothetical protein CTI12_AA390750 [Artemisia annua]|uniref:Uncharacterized protein n=1 Tax=Artemisia annua TaxID=35608 RepID=A0A2U1ME58_ARTAN|nr:hypothetical protein CTI12_AA390750 [Artemisia annua]
MADKDRECVASGSPTCHFESFSLDQPRHNLDPRVLNRLKKHIFDQGPRIECLDASKTSHLSSPQAIKSPSLLHFEAVR